MNGAIIGGILGGISGAASANLDQLKLEAEQERKNSYLKLTQEYGTENIKLADKLANARQDTADKRADKRADDALLVGQQNKQIDDLNKQAHDDSQYSLDVEKMKQAKELANIQAGSNKGELAKTVETMRLNGVPEDKIQNFLLRNSSDAVSTENIIKARTEAFKAVNEMHKDAIAAEQIPEKRKALEAKRDEEVEALTSKMIGRPHVSSGNTEQTKNIIGELAEKPGGKGIVSGSVSGRVALAEQIREEGNTPISRQAENISLTGGGDVGIIEKQLEEESRARIQSNPVDKPVDKPVENFDSLKAKTKQAITKQAQAIKDTGDKRPVQDIINAILEERAKAR